MSKECSESVFSQIVSELERNNYKIANCIGIAELLTDKTHVGILKPRELTERNILFRLLKYRTKAMFIGVLWLNNKVRRAEANKRWILEVYGKEHTEELTKLIERIAKHYRVEVIVNLESDLPRSERSYSEYCTI